MQNLFCKLLAKAGFHPFPTGLLCPFIAGLLQVLNLYIQNLLLAGIFFIQNCYFLLSVQIRLLIQFPLHIILIQSDPVIHQPFPFIRRPVLFPLQLQDFAPPFADKLSDFLFLFPEHVYLL